MGLIPDPRRRACVLAGATASLLLAGCATTTPRCVDIPPPDDDPTPSVVVRANPFRPASDPNAPTGVELPNPTSAAGARATTLFSKVEVGVHLQISATALNGGPPRTTGGVERLTLTIAQADSVVLQGMSEAARDERGKAPSSLAFLYGNIHPKRPIEITVGTVPIIVTATATNFNGKSNTLTVTYAPVDRARRR